MVSYIARRLGFAIPTVLLVCIGVFGLVRAIPGDPVQVMMGDSGTAQQLAYLRHQLGLDQPVPVQFLAWFGRVLHGNLGHSLVNGQAVLPLVLQRAEVSGTVVVLAVLISALIAVPLGTLAAWKQDSRLDIGMVIAATILLSLPSFWLGILLLLLFGLNLGWLPVVGFVSFSTGIFHALLFLILPVLTLVLVETGTLLRMARASTIEVLRLEYIMHARAKGLSEARILFRHALPNAFAPTWTLIGLVLGHLLGGIAVLETVFTLPGLGRLLVDSIFARDYPVIQGCLLFTAIVYVAINLLVDLCYPLFDPRIVMD
jgi:peptide/nickel transport system permease protein